MTQQPTLFSQGAPAPPQAPDPLPGPSPVVESEPSPSGRQPAPQQAPSWLQLIELSVRVVVRLYLGLVIIVLPWTHFWSDNRLLLFIPHLAAIALNGATRGIVSGLGLLNIWIGVHDAVHFKER
ncbi:MAG: hypothetical protein WA634_02860 [Silvibacterium sp.]